MRLLNVETFSLTEFSGKSTPAYAVLSHRWTADEVTYQDICSEDADKKSGFLKIQCTAQQAQRDGVQYMWIDTCCIDKQNSTELSEAINSMYDWYRKSRFCYVYLHDFDRRKNHRKKFRHCEWFKRGWTLQELLAPQAVRFYDKRWKFLGDKTTLANEISQITGINIDALKTGNIQKYSVAQKMSWAATRNTTRVEDRAYCLLGLFHVNMSPMYGEGEQAFLRLQENIIKDNDDQSIFAWFMGTTKFSGLLAPSADAFAGCGSMISQPSLSGRSPFSITNRGLSIKLQITQWSADTYLAYLECSHKLDRPNHPGTSVGVFLRRLTEDDQYARVSWNGQDLFLDEHHIHDQPDCPLLMRKLFIRKSVNEEQEKRCLRDYIYGFRLPRECLRRSKIHVDKDRLHKHCAILLPGGWGQTMVIDTSAERLGVRQITLGFDFDFNPVCLVEDECSDLRDECKGKHVTSGENRCVDWSNNFPDDFDWYDIYEGDKASRKDDHNGMWALKGHRLYGMNVFLPVSNSHGGLWVALSRDVDCVASAWELYVSDMASPNAGNGNRHFERSFVNRRNFQASYGLKSTSEDIEEGTAIIKALYSSVSSQPQI